MIDLKRKIDEELKDVRLSENLKERILDQAEKTKPIPLEKHCQKPRWRWLLTAAVVGIFVMMIPVTIFAVTSLYKISFRKDENRDGSLTVVIEKEKTSSEMSTSIESAEESATIIWNTIIEIQENPDGSFRYYPRKEAWIEEGDQKKRIDIDQSEQTFYFLSFTYLPEGIRRSLEEPQKYETATGELAITPILIILNEEQKWEIPYLTGKEAKAFEVNGHSAFAVYKENGKGFCEIGMALEDRNLLLDMFVGSEISEEELKMILSGVVVEEKPYSEEGFSEMPATVKTYEEFVKLWGGENHE